MITVRSVQKCRCMWTGSRLELRKNCPPCFFDCDPGGRLISSSDFSDIMSSHDEKLIIDAIHFVNLCMSNRKLMLQKQKGPPQFMYFRFLSVQLLHPFTFPLCVWISYCNLPYFLYTDSRAINWFNFIWFFDWRTIIFIAGQCNTTEKWQLWQLVFCKVKGKEWCWRADHGTQELQLRYD